MRLQEEVSWGPFTRFLSDVSTTGRRKTRHFFQAFVVHFVSLRRSRDDLQA